MNWEFVDQYHIRCGRWTISKAYVRRDPADPATRFAKYTVWFDGDMYPNNPWNSADAAKECVEIAEQGRAK